MSIFGKQGTRNVAWEERKADINIGFRNIFMCGFHIIFRILALFHMQVSTLFQCMSHVCQKKEGALM